MRGRDKLNHFEGGMTLREAYKEIMDPHCRDG